ncbi:MAG: sterol desaturase family protein [Sphingomonas sp.]|nr:sterol desaturase family protein [Sphingomonas sp.]
MIRRWIEPRRIQPRKASFADRRREFRQSMETLLVFAFVNLATFALVRSGIIPVHRGTPDAWMLAWQLPAMVLLHDAWFYWMHRTLHHKSLFRRAHYAHHLSRTPTSWAAYSFAPIEAVAESIYIPMMFIALGWIAPIEAWAVFIFLGHQIARNAIGHSGFELAWPGFTRSPLTGWLTTTTHHDLHHTEGRYNFGLYFTWWDRMMGTEHPKYHERFEDVVGRRAAAAPVEAEVELA